MSLQLHKYRATEAILKQVFWSGSAAKDLYQETDDHDRCDDVLRNCKVWHGVV